MATFFRSRYCDGKRVALISFFCSLKTGSKMKQAVQRFIIGVKRSVALSTVIRSIQFLCKSALIPLGLWLIKIGPFKPFWQIDLLII